MDMLIFRSRFVSWDDLAPGGPYAQRPKAHYGKGEVSLKSFPMPGRMEPALSPCTIDDDGVRFGEWGAHFVQSPYSVAKVLLLDPEWDQDRVAFEIIWFVAATSWHSGVDSRLPFDETTRTYFRPRRLAEKLFRSDQPLGLKCGHVCQLLAHLLSGFGVESRRVTLKNDCSIGHIFLDVRLPVADAWVMVDVDIDVMIKSNGRFLSSEEIFEARQAGRTSDLEVHRISGKPCTISEFSVPTIFYGQFSWRPEMMFESDARVAERYVSNIIQRGYQKLVFHPFAFGGDDGGPWSRLGKTKA